MEIRGKKVLVTGGAGAIGRNLLHRVLAEEPASVVAFDNLSSGVVENIPQGVDFERGDVRDVAGLTKLFDTHAPSVVFHLAAHFANQNSVDHPAEDLDSNALGCVHLLELARRRGVERFLYTSSSCVYQPSHEPLDDHFPPTAYDTPYAISKGAGESYMRFYGEHHGLSTVSARLFNSFGPGEYPGRYRNVIPNFIGQALAGQPLTITGTGEERRTFTYVEDTADMLVRLAMAETSPGAVYNVGAERDTAIGELAELVNRLAGNEAGTRYMPRRSWDHVVVRRAALERLREAIGPLPFTPLSKGLEKTIAWARADVGRFLPERQPV